MPAPKFSRRSYYNGAQEHLALALRLREGGEHFAAHYFAGVAVESILRALSTEDDQTFDGTHDIKQWAKKSGLLPNNPSNQSEFVAKFHETNLRWRANQRYYTVKMLDTWLYHLNIDGSVKGDRVKVSTERMLELANDIVKRGVLKCKNRF